MAMRPALFLTVVLVAVLAAFALWVGASPQARGPATGYVEQSQASASSNAQQQPSTTASSPPAVEAGRASEPRQSLTETVSPGASAKGSEGNKSKARAWGPPTLMNLEIAVYGFEKIYAAYRAV